MTLTVVIYDVSVIYDVNKLVIYDVSVIYDVTVVSVLASYHTHHLRAVLTLISMALPQCLAVLSFAVPSRSLQPPLPALARDFYTGALRSDSKMSGPTYAVKDGVCCPLGAIAVGTSCSVTTQAIGSDTYEQGSKERTRTDSAQGSIVTWFGSVMKQMVIQPSNGTAHKYDCAAYCPIQGKFHSTVSIGDAPDPPFSFTKPRHLALPGEFTQPASAGGKTQVCDRWRWEEKISVLPMGFITAYVDTKSTPPQIFGLAKSLVPLKAWENTSFPGFTPAERLNGSLDLFFDVDPQSLARCPLIESGCFNNSNGAVAYGAVAARGDSSVAGEPGEAALSAMNGRAARVLRAAADARSREQTPRGAAPPAPPLPNVTFVTQYTTTIEQYTIASQNADTLANGDLCCSYGKVGAAPICSASIARTSGVRYYDLPNQRYRFEDAGNAPGSGVVSDYKTHKRMFVSYKNGTEVETCSSYCPIDPRDQLKPDFFGFGNDVKDLGKASWHGKAAEHYHWVEKADPLPIELDTVDFYADISSPQAAIPLFKQTSITPLGVPPEGFFNQTYKDFKAGPPDPKKFEIADAATCPKSSSCQSPELQAERLALGQFHTFMLYA
jgi:hypothetical protein